MLTTYQGEPAVAYASVGDSRVSVWHKATGRYELAALDDQLLRLLLAPPANRPPWVAAILQTHKLAEDLQISPVEMVKLAKALDSLANPNSASPLAQALFTERNLVTQSLGMPTIKPHVGLVKIGPGDRVLLATDGLHDNLTEDEITELLLATPIDEVAAALVVRAHEVAGSMAVRAKKDDITAIVLEIV
jgi:serine/threonine protein phosphatase PrpC